MSGYCSAHWAAVVTLTAVPVFTTCAALSAVAETVIAPPAGAAEGSYKYVPIRFVALMTAEEVMAAPVMVSTFCPGFAGSSSPMNWSV